MPARGVTADRHGYLPQVRPVQAGHGGIEVIQICVQNDLCHANRLNSAKYEHMFYLIIRTYVLKINRQM